MDKDNLGSELTAELLSEFEVPAVTTELWTDYQSWMADRTSQARAISKMLSETLAYRLARPTNSGTETRSGTAAGWRIGEVSSRPVANRGAAYRTPVACAVAAPHAIWPDGSQVASVKDLGARRSWRKAPRKNRTRLDCESPATAISRGSFGWRTRPSEASRGARSPATAAVRQLPQACRHHCKRSCR